MRMREPAKSVQGCWMLERKRKKRGRRRRNQTHSRKRKAEDTPLDSTTVLKEVRFSILDFFPDSTLSPYELQEHSPRTPPSAAPLPSRMRQTMKRSPFTSSGSLAAWL